MRGKCGVCGEKRKLAFLLMDHDWNWGTECWVCKRCARKTWHKEFAASIPERRTQRDLILRKQERERRKREKARRAALKRLEAEREQFQLSKPRVPSTSGITRTRTGEGNIPRMKRLIAQGRTDEQILAEFSALYADKDKDDKWIRARVRTYKRIAMKELGRS